MDPDLKAWTNIGTWKKVKINFHEIAERLEALERENNELKARIEVLECKARGPLKKLQAGTPPVPKNQIG